MLSMFPQKYFSQTRRMDYMFLFPTFEEIVVMKNYLQFYSVQNFFFFIYK